MYIYKVQKREGTVIYRSKRGKVQLCIECKKGVYRNIYIDIYKYIYK